VLLVFSSLIIPVLATRKIAGGWRLIAAYNLGAVSYLVGLIASALLDISSGAAIVCTLAGMSVAAAKLIFGRLPQIEPAGVAHPLPPQIPSPIQVALSPRRAA
jgi:zinc/manganese transport system permease protein